MRKHFKVMITANENFSYSQLFFEKLDFLLQRKFEMGELVTLVYTDKSFLSDIADSYVEQRKINKDAISVRRGFNNVIQNMDEIEKKMKSADVLVAFTDGKSYEVNDVVHFFEKMQKKISIVSFNDDLFDKHSEKLLYQLHYETTAENFELLLNHRSRNLQRFDIWLLREEALAGERIELPTLLENLKNKNIPITNQELETIQRFYLNESVSYTEGLFKPILLKELILSNLILTDSNGQKEYRFGFSKHLINQLINRLGIIYEKEGVFG